MMAQVRIMKILLSYYEIIEKLNSRVKVHDHLADKDIDPWILDLVRLEKHETILDVGCGTGKQVLSFGKELNGTVHICATDISKDILIEARNNALRNNISNVTYIQHNMNKEFPFDDHSFDLISSCFAVYYVDNAEDLLAEFVRLLNRSGRLFICGPTPNNSLEFWELHSEVTGKPIDVRAMARKDRIHNEFIPLIKKLFKGVTIRIFHNSIHFHTTSQIMDYYTASPLFKESYSSDEERTEMLEAMKKNMEEIITDQGEYVVKKEVYGVLGTNK
jgi:ubiquinone/menaquinone biosynthesis C-methylase UbiE